MESFGKALRRFARATDTVRHDVVDQVRTQLQEYVDQALDVKNVDIMRNSAVNQSPGLGKLGSDNNVQEAFSISDQNGVYTCHVAQAYDHGQPVWVVAPDGGSLGQADRYLDLWSGVTDLPGYWPPTETLDPKTSIILPLRHEGSKVGALCLDSESSLEITEAAKEELGLIAEALAMLMVTREATATAQASKRYAIQELKNIIPADPGLTVPHVFVASPGDAPDDVVKAILGVLERDEFHRRFTSTHWKEDPEPGPVAPSVMDEITHARFGICYLSEPAEEGADTRYRDNDNVLFEAGMFQSLREVDYSAGWVPVREADAPEPPFYVDEERYIVVPRKDDGSLRQPEFEEELCQFVRALVPD